MVVGTVEMHWSGQISLRGSSRGEAGTSDFLSVSAHLLAVLCPEEPGQALTGSFLPALPTKTPVGAKPLSCHGPASGLFGRPCETTSGMLRTQEGSTGGSQSLASAQAESDLCKSFQDFSMEFPRFFSAATPQFRQWKGM